MANSLSNLVNNLSEEIHRIKCKYKHDDKKFETCGINNKYCKSNQNAWLKLCIDMNIDLRKKSKNDFEKDFF